MQDLRNQRRERLAIENFPDQERGLEFSAQKAETTVGLWKAFLAREQDVCRWLVCRTDGSKGIRRAAVAVVDHTGSLPVKAVLFLGVRRMI